MSAAPDSEFHRLIRFEELDAGDIDRTIDATQDERRALARRFNLPAIDRLRAVMRIRRVSGGPLLRVEGRLTADVKQRCVVTLAALPAHIEEDFVETFGPPGYRPTEESVDTDRPEVFDDNGIDLGELAAQILFVSLDPYPRAPGADAALRPYRPADDADRSRPFAALGEMLGKQRK
ncbi:MAG: DUF177 domain-containing protein [Rhodospirillales bacterium]|nr:MAG: DUF177 domain-containing protein [Rhodospirillales bacterium]